jgi:aryl-alcohol dehydrogenase-like predicted oxidoreductase
MVTSVILGARTGEQLQDNLGAAGSHVSEEETDRLDTASDPAPARLPVRRAGTDQRSRGLAGTDAG